MSIKLENHPSLLHNAEVVEICRPLEDLYGIDYFSHVNVDNAGNFALLAKNPKFFEHYINAQYFNCDTHLSKADLEVEYVMQDVVSHYGNTEKLFQDCSEFKLHHIFTILHRNKNSVDAYHFATSTKDNKANEIYLRILPLLQNFISYFKESTKNNKNLASYHDLRYQIDASTAAYESDSSSIYSEMKINDFLKSVSTKRHHMPSLKA